MGKSSTQSISRYDIDKILKFAKKSFQVSSGAESSSLAEMLRYVFEGQPLGGYGQGAWLVESKDWGEVVVLYENNYNGIYLLRVAPGKRIPLHHHKIMAEKELVLGAGLQMFGKVLKLYQKKKWRKLQLHHYDNATRIWQQILCVDLPAFIPTDEVVE